MSLLPALMAVLAAVMLSIAESRAVRMWSAGGEAGRLCLVSKE
jgi:hypothetical protein